MSEQKDEVRRRGNSHIPFTVNWWGIAAAVLVVFLLVFFAVAS